MIDESAAATGDWGEPELPPRPPFFSRLWMVFVQPGKLYGDLVRNPAWFPIALVVAAVTAAVMWFTPEELFRQAALSGVSGEQAAEIAEGMAQVPPIVIKGGAVGMAFLGSLLFPIILSAITYVCFVFIRGDEARFKQHLSVVAHAGVISALGAILNGIVNNLGGALEETLSVGTFLPFLPDGYFTELLLALDLFQLWGAAVVGIGLAAIDPRRRAGSTVAVLLALVLVVGLIRAAF